MSEPKLTPWFPGSVKPARPGLYDVRNDPSVPLHHNDRMFLTARRRKFDGTNWRGGWMWEVVSIFGQHPAHQWRGLAAEACPHPLKGQQPMTTPSLPEAAKLARDAQHLLERYEYSSATLVLREAVAALGAALAASAEPMEPAWMTAFDDARDAILHDRHALAEEGMTNDQTNAVLSILDDAFMPHLKRGAVETSESVISPKSKLMMLDKLAKGRGFRNATEALASLARTTPPAQAEPSAQEPAAWREMDGDDWVYYHPGDKTFEHIAEFQKDRHGISIFPLYTSPQTSASVAAAVQAPAEGAQEWRQHVEQRMRTWRQRTTNKSGDRLALDDFMGESDLDDLVDFVCDEWAEPATPQPQPASPEQAQAKQDVQAVPEGFVLVPREPTDEMLQACNNGPGQMVLTNREIWRAMTAASQT